MEPFRLGYWSENIHSLKLLGDLTKILTVEWFPFKPDLTGALAICGSEDKKRRSARVGPQDEMSREELLRSLDGPSWTARAKGAERIAELYCRGGLDGATRRIAEDAFRVLRWD